MQQCSRLISRSEQASFRKDVDTTSALDWFKSPQLGAFANRRLHGLLAPGQFLAKEAHIVGFHDTGVEISRSKRVWL